MRQGYDEQCYDQQYQGHQIENGSVFIKEPKHYELDQTTPSKSQLMKSRQHEGKQYVEYYQQAKQHVGSSHQVSKDSRHQVIPNNSKQSVQSGWKLEPARVRSTVNHRIDPEQLVRVSSDNNALLEYNFEKIIHENLKQMSVQQLNKHISHQHSYSMQRENIESHPIQDKLLFVDQKAAAAVDFNKHRGKTAPKTYQNTVVHHSKFFEKSPARPQSNQSVFCAEPKAISYGHEEGGVIYSKNPDIVQSSSKPMFEIRADKNYNAASVMSQDPIPLKSSLRSTDSSLNSIKSGFYLKESRESAPRKINIRYNDGAKPHVQVNENDGLSRGSRLSHNLSMQRGSAYENDSGNQSYEVRAYNQKEVRRSERSESIIANLNELKFKLGKISVINQQSMSICNQTELSTNKNTPHSTAVESENNSLQSIPINVKPADEYYNQNEAFKFENKNKSAIGIPISEKRKEGISEGITPREQSFKQHYARFQGEWKNDFQPKESKDTELVYGNKSSYIKLNELISSTTQRGVRHTCKQASQNTGLTHDQSSRTEFSPISCKGSQKGGMRFTGDSKESEHLGLLLEEYQNSVSKMKRSKSENGVRKPLPTQKEPPNALLDSIKDISKSLVKSTKNYLANKLQLPDARLKCACNGDLSRHETCKKAMTWLMVRYKPTELEYLKKTYEKLFTEAEIDAKSQKQIKLDVSRTFPEHKYYSAEGGGLSELQRVLECFARYDPQVGKLITLYFLKSNYIIIILVGYVQGMNFIAASFLYHAEEYVAFWLLVMMFELFEMRDIYQNSNIYFINYSLTNIQKLRSSWTHKAFTGHCFSYTEPNPSTAYTLCK